MEEVFDEAFLSPEDLEASHGPTYFILKKVADIKRDRQFIVDKTGEAGLVHRV
ncbi:MAG: hypothetical protein WCW44_06055 [archaeon]|jgi:hypothetical protein